MSNETKYLIVESPVHNQEVLLALTATSDNVKTGAMAQLYILHPDDYPLEISKQGKDDRVCGECPLRHSLGGACYVTLFQGPRGIYMGWSNSGKRVDDPHTFLEACAGKYIRIGAYGDPANIPSWLANEIINAAKAYTAYTHQFRNPRVAATWKGKAMASCDTPSQLRMAESLGWSAFLASPESLEGVELCANEREGIQCIDCLKCNGAQGSVMITPHGSLAARHPSFKGKKR
jgi:hypothetical protein